MSRNPTVGLQRRSSKQSRAEQSSRMATWSAENATKAFLRTLKSTNTNAALEPNTAEFLSALAAGKGSRLMVEICHNSPGPTTLALIAAAHQTGGRVICILPDGASNPSLPTNAEASLVELVATDTDEARRLLLSDYRGADFVVVDCRLESYEKVFRAAQECRGGLVVGCNAMLERNLGAGGGGGWEMCVEFLPIGGGMRVWRRARLGRMRKSRWVMRVDDCTGEENVFDKENQKAI